MEKKAPDALEVAEKENEARKEEKADKGLTVSFKYNLRSTIYPRVPDE